MNKLFILTFIFVFSLSFSQEKKRDNPLVGLVLSGGGATPATTATARAILGNPNGIGADPVVDLKASGVMFNSKPEGIEGGDFITGDEIFRQVVLLRNPRVDSANGTFLSTTTARAVDKIITDGNSFVKSNVQKSTILGGTSGAQGIIDDTNDSSSVWYHQNETTGFTPFQVNESISVVGNASINGTIQSITDGEFNPFTGDLLYIDNRSAVTRSTDQTEDLKIVITI
ncbi:MAG: hypothetical protein P8O09_02010 [Flavobacteriaceae bacterium]|nr:hypothetical protein [Flavobacteriaceae bacterium]